MVAYEFVTLEGWKSGTGDCTYRGADGEARPVAKMLRIVVKRLAIIYGGIFSAIEFSAAGAEYRLHGPSASNNHRSMFYDRR